MAQYRNIVFTVNNPQPNEAGSDLLEPDNWEACSFCVYQRERGENGTVHFQGYAEFTSRLRLTSIKALTGLERAHIEARRGSQKQAIAYCEKEDTRIEGPWTFGEAKKQGKRSDLLAVQEAVQEGATDIQLFDDYFATMVRYNRGVLMYKRMKSTPRLWETRVITLVGPSGCGKSRWAFANFPGAYSKGPGKWWDGYDGHEVVIIDEMYGSRFAYTELLRLLDRYPATVEGKGTVLNFCPRTVILTSNAHPKDWYADMQFPWPQSALRRRLTQNDSVIYTAGEPQRVMGEVILHLPAPPPALPFPLNMDNGARVDHFHP